MPDAAFLQIFESMHGPARGLVPEPVDLYGYDAEQKLRDAAPAIIELNGRTIGLLKAGRGRITVLHADGTTARLPIDRLWRDLTQSAAEPHRQAIDDLLDTCGIPPARRGRAFDAILRERIRTTKLGVLHQLRTPPGAPFLAQLRQAGVFRRAAALIAAHAGEYLLWLAAWWILGSAALGGRIDTGMLAAWALLLATIVPLRMLKTWLQGAIAIGAGGLLRQRLLSGALKLEPEEVRHEGAGSFLGRAIEAESIETLALGGGISSALALFEIALATGVLAFGASAAAAAILLPAWTAFTALLALRYWRSRERWTRHRLTMTHHLIESMTGHRTRLAQQPSSEWHESEDRAAAEYIALSRGMDRDSARLSALAPRGWLAAGIAALAPAFLAPTIAPPAQLAIALGGILLAWQALRRLSGGLAQLAGAAISWRQVATLFRAAARTEPDAPEIQSSGDLIVDARDLAFRYRPGSEPVLASASLTIHRGDRVLLEGESGGGKSTFAALISGLRLPTSGVVLKYGEIAAAPQYHENHILTGPFAYNLLMGRAWPAPQADMLEAETVARELGLGPLLERMPGGMLQMVGETGWQLSQGERSRVFLARAILQDPGLVILDESFAALDPENLRSSLECALRRAKSLLVIAHP